MVRIDYDFPLCSLAQQMWNLLQSPHQGGDFQFRGPIPRLRGIQKFGQKHNRFDINLKENIVLRITLDVVNYNSETVLFGSIKIHIKLTLLIVMMKMNINDQNFLEYFEDFHFFVDK